MNEKSNSVTKWMKKKEANFDKHLLSLHAGSPNYRD